MKSLVLVAAVILTGCVSTPVNDFDRIESFVKPISPGLYFIREIAPGGLFGKAKKPVAEWHKRAASLCSSGYKTLVHSDEDLAYQGVSISVLGGLVMATPSSSKTAAVDGVVLCQSSSLSEDEAIQILIDEYYLVPDDA